MTKYEQEQREEAESLTDQFFRNQGYSPNDVSDDDWREVFKEKLNQIKDADGDFD